MKAAGPFPASRAPFPGGDLYRLPEAPAVWKIKIQRPNPASKNGKTAPNVHLQTAEVFLGKNEAREMLAFGNGETQEHWRVGEERFRFDAQTGFAARDLSPTSGSVSPPIGAPDRRYRWSEMQELSWISKESFWFRHDTPSGSLLVFIEDEESYDPDPESDPQSIPKIIPKKPGAAPEKESEDVPPELKSAKKTSENPPPPEPNLFPEANQPVREPEPEPKGGKILPPAPSLPSGLIPGVQLKASVKAAAIDAKTRLPLLVQIGTETLVYTYETVSTPPALPAPVSNLTRKDAPQKVNPEVPLVPLP